MTRWKEYPWLRPCTVSALALWSLGSAQANPHAELRAGQDYYSWQIATGEPSALRAQMARYRALPFVRIERRGTQYVLRAGMWANAAQAQAALTNTAPPGAFIRVATYRPEAIVEQNWENALRPSPDVPAPSQAPATRPPEAPRPPPPKHGRAALDPAEDAAMRAFNPGDYTLAFEVFLGAGDLQRAFQVARKAVANQPKNLDWRRKLARVADWSNQALVAWEQWHYLFQNGDVSDETTHAVLRLAAFAGQPDVAAQVWKLRAQRQPLEDAQWRDLLRMVEEGEDVAAGSRYFESQFRRWNNVTLLEYAAQLAYNTGDDARALQLYRERATLPPFSLTSTLRAVALLLRQARLREALDLMQSQAPHAPKEMDEFWRIYANTAWELQERALAETAYRNYADSPQATAADWSRLIYLARLQSPQSGADLAMEAYRRWGRWDDFMLALSIYAQIADLAGQERALAMLSDKDLQHAQEHGAFLLLRAQYHQHRGALADAMRDLQRAHELAPTDTQTSLSLLWFLVDQGHKDALRQLLAQLEPQGQDKEAYWSALAAAHQVLGQAHNALRWYQKAVRRNGADALLLMNYADALQATRHVGMADRVRRHAWLQLRSQPQAADTVVPHDKQTDLLAWLRLRLQNQTSEANHHMVRSIAAQLRGLEPQELKERTQVHQLVTAWALSTQQYANARAWMWWQQARKEVGPEYAPVWARSQVALQLDDRQAMRALLDAHAPSLPPVDRYDATRALGHEEQALSLVFDAMLRHADDAQLHERQRLHAPQAAGYVQYRLQHESHGDVFDSRAHQMEADFALTPRLHLSLGWEEATQSSHDTALKTLTPGKQQITHLGLRYRNHNSQSQLRLFQRDALASHMGFSAEHAWTWNTHLALSAALAYRADATDSMALRVAGTQDHVQWGATYALEKRTYVRWGGRWALYHTQHESTLGESWRNEVELGYRFRLEYPDMRVRLYTSDQRTSVHSAAAQAEVLARLPAAFQAHATAVGMDPLAYFLPPTTSTWAACVDVGASLESPDPGAAYSRALRPFSQLCTLDPSRSGSGYSAAVGVTGAVWGTDQLMFRLEQNEGGIGNPGGTLGRAWSLRYRHYY